MQFKGKSRFDGKNRFRPQNTHKVTHSFCGQLGETLFYRGFAAKRTFGFAFERHPNRGRGRPRRYSCGA